jgi:hypothetical protein
MRGEWIGLELHKLFSICLFLFEAMHLLSDDCKDVAFFRSLHRYKPQNFK